MENKSGDIFGIAPYGEALKIAVSKTFDGAAVFLQTVCQPALEELGLMLQDKTRLWRLNNVVQMIEKSNGKFELRDNRIELKVHPRVAISIMESSSLCDDETLQDLWAGLLVSSCTETGRDDANLVFVNLLKQLTVMQAHILKYSVEQSRKFIHPNNLITAGKVGFDIETLYKVTGSKDFHRLDREIDYLRSLDLISGGFSISTETLSGSLAPTGLGLNLYIRAQGSQRTIYEYWKTDLVPWVEATHQEKATFLVL